MKFVKMSKSFLLRLILVLVVNNSVFAITPDQSESQKQSIPSSGVNDRNGRIRSERDNKERIALLNQIKSLDHMKCFPKVLCGLSVDSSKNSKDIDSNFVRSYIQLMRSTNPEDDSNEETKPSSDKTKDALSLFLIKSGLLKPKKKSQTASVSASSEEDSEEEEDETPQKSRVKKKSQALRTLLSKRKLHASSDDPDDPYMLYPVLHLNTGVDEMTPEIKNKDKLSSSSLTSQIGSLVSSWVPWLSLSFARDSEFESDPFFKKGQGQVSQKSKEKWEKDLEKLALLMHLRDEEIKRKKGTRTGRRRILEKNEKGDGTIVDDEIQVYSTAVEIGKKLKDTKQCDYLYNGCPVPYQNIIKIIASIRKEIKQSDETVEALSKEIFDYMPASNKKNGKRPSLPGGRKPMTQISHTLPNGEKVEIKVQLSGKQKITSDSAQLEIESPYDEYTPQEPEKEEPDEVPIKLPSKKVAPSVSTFEGDVLDPATISSSYELEEEKLDEGNHKKPSPLDIFNNISIKKKPTTTTTTTTTTSTTTTTKRPLTTKYAIAKKTKRPPNGTQKTTTKRPKNPKPVSTTTKKPRNTRRPMTKRPSVLSPRFTIRPTATSEETEPESDFPLMSSTSTITKRPRVSQTTKRTSNTNHSNDSLKAAKTRPKDRTPAVDLDSAQVSEIISTKKQKYSGNRQTSSIYTSITTSQKPIMIDNSEVEESFSFPPSQKIIIQVDQEEEEEEDDEDSPTTTPLPHPTTLPALAFFTKSYMDDVLHEQVYRPKPQYPIASSNPYSVNRKRRPEGNSYHSTIPTLFPHHHHIKGTGESYVTSVESGSGEVRPSSGSSWSDLGDDLEGHGESGKKRIKYKNPKRPYLILATGNMRQRPTINNAQSDPSSAFYEDSSPLVLEPGSPEHFNQWMPS